MWVSSLTGPFGYLNPYLLAIKVGVGIGLTVINTDEQLQSGESFGKAFLKGSLITGAQIGAAKVGQIAGDAASGFGKVISEGIKVGTQVALSKFVETYVSTDSFQASLEKGLIYGAVAGIARGLNKSFNPSLNTQGPFEGSLDTSKFTFENISNTLVENVAAILTNPNTYVNLLQCGIQELYAHRLKNLTNDFEEFNNNLKATQDMLDILNAKFNNTLTAEYVCKMQLALGRYPELFPDMALSMTPDMVINLSLASGTEIAKTILSKPSTFTEDMLTMEGYTPSTLYYTQTDPTLLWDVT
jgi:hypothetical protein